MANKLYFKIVVGQFATHDGYIYKPGVLTEQGIPEAIETTVDLTEQFPGQFEYFDEIHEKAKAKVEGRYVPTPEEVEKEDPFKSFGAIDFTTKFNPPEGFIVRGTDQGWYRLIRVDERRQMHDKAMREDKMVDLVADLVEASKGKE